MADKSTDKNSNDELEPTSESNYHLQKANDQHEQPTKAFTCCSSENSINIKQNSLVTTGKDIRQKIVSRVKSWSSREKNLPNNSSDVENVVMNSTKNTDEGVKTSAELVLRKKNSLDNLGCDEKSHYSDESASRSCTLFSFDKKNRKNRRDPLRKRKKCMLDAATLKKDVNLLKKDDKHTLPSKPAIDLKAVEDGYDNKYKVLPKCNKSVLFINEVYVVYFKGDDVICESKEPLKKDVEQQQRNKEMRQGYLLKTQKKYNICLY